MELLNELDFESLPDNDGNKWLFLERQARSRLLRALEDIDSSLSPNELKAHYMETVESLAEVYAIENVARQRQKPFDQSYDLFLLAVTKAQTLILAKSQPPNETGVVAIEKATKKRILELLTEIEDEIECGQLSGSRSKALHKLLEDFRREIAQPRTRLSAAITLIAQISTIGAMTTAAAAQGTTAYLNILQILGAEQSKATSQELDLIEEEKTLLLAPPPKQLEAPKPDEMK